MHRKQRLRDWGTRYAIKVDGETAAKVFSGRSVSFDVEPGNHTIYCQLQVMSKSPPVEFIVADTPVEFECEPRLGTIASPIENLIDADQHIVLRPLT